MRNVFNGRLLKVFVRKVRLPNGYLATFEMIKHPGAALIVPLISPDKLIMLRQLRPVIKKYIYELPAGTIGRGESAISCAKREIIEETGYSAKNMKRLGYIYPVPGYSTEKIVIYRAEGLVRAPCASEKDEVIKISVLTRSAVRRLFRSRRITDAKTIAALAFCGWI